MNKLYIIIALIISWAVSASAQVTLPKGIYWLQGKGGSLSAAMALSYVDGASLRRAWATLESADGVYNWSAMDSDLNVIAAAHKHAQLTSPVGQQSPCWLRNEGVQVYHDYATFDANCQAHPNETFAATDTSKQSTIAVPWDSTYLIKLNSFVQALAAHLSATGHLGLVTGVSPSGIAFATSETRLVNPTDTAGWTAVSYSRAKIKSAFTTLFTDWARAFPNAAVAPHFLYDSFPQGFGSCKTPDDLFPRELIDNAYAISPTQAVMGYNGLNNSPTINAGSGPGNLLPQSCAIQRGPGNLWQDCEQSKESCENGTDANTFQGTGFTPHVAYEGLQEYGEETNTFATEWGFARAAYTQLLFIEVFPQGFTTANQAALTAAHNALIQ